MLKKITATILCLILAIGCALPALADESVKPFYRNEGTLFVEREPANPDNPSMIIGRPTEAQPFLNLRLRTFALRFNCGIVLSLWKTLEDTNYSTLDDVAIETIKEEYGDDVIYLFYVKDTNTSLISRGSGLFGDFSGNDVATINSLLQSTEVENDFYRVVNVINELWRILGTDPITISMSLDGSVEESNENLEEALAPLRQVYHGHIQVETNYGTRVSDEDFDELWHNRNSELNYLDYFEDTVYIYYNGNTGKTYVNIGADTGISVDDISKIEGAFKPASGTDDYSGIEAGVTALANALGGESQLSVSTVLKAMVVIALLLTSVILRSKGKKENSKSKDKKNKNK